MTMSLLESTDMVVIGLTGSIGMGKSTLAAQFSRFGAAVCDSDRIVHALLGKRGAAVEPVAAAFPGTLRDGAIDRALLGSAVFGDEHMLKALEQLLHPLVKREQQRFLRLARMRRKRVAVLDIPLLFETGGEAQCDYTVVAYAPRFLQAQRVLRRPRMSMERLERIRARQMPDHEKCRYADFTICTGLGKYASRKKIASILRRVLTRTAERL